MVGCLLFVCQNLFELILSFRRQESPFHIFFVLFLSERASKSTQQTIIVRQHKWRLFTVPTFHCQIFSKDRVRTWTFHNFIIWGNTLPCLQSVTNGMRLSKTRDQSEWWPYILFLASENSCFIFPVMALKHVSLKCSGASTNNFADKLWGEVSICKQEPSDFKPRSPCIREQSAAFCNQDQAKASSMAMNTRSIPIIFPFLWWNSLNFGVGSSHFSLVHSSGRQKVIPSSKPQKRDEEDATGGGAEFSLNLAVTEIEQRMLETDSQSTFRSDHDDVLPTPAGQYKRRFTHVFITVRPAPALRLWSVRKKVWRSLFFHLTKGEYVVSFLMSKFPCCLRQPLPLIKHFHASFFVAYKALKVQSRWPPRGVSGLMSVHLFSVLAAVLTHGYVNSLSPSCQIILGLSFFSCSVWAKCGVVTRRNVTDAWRVAACLFKHFPKEFLGDLYHTWWWKITYRHQEAKCVNASLKVLYLFNFSHIYFFQSLSGCSWYTKCQKNKFFILHVFMAKKPIWLTW